MAFESRGNGRYYYRKRREGGRVVSEYVGAGELAELCAKMDRIERARTELARFKTIKSRAAFERIDGDLDAAFGINETLIEALFLINDFYQHKGQWRRKKKP